MGQREKINKITREICNELKTKNDLEEYIAIINKLKSA